MKKIVVFILVVIMLSFSGLALSASRTISGSQVTVTITPGEELEMTVIERLSGGATFKSGSFPASSCGVNQGSTILTCSGFSGSDVFTVSYQVDGSGTVTGTVDGVDYIDFTPETMAITGASQIVASVPCTSFTYNDWTPAVCPVSGTQTRTVASSTPAGCTGGSPVTSQSCNYQAPTCTSFTYTAWGDCQSSGTQTRTVASSTPAGCSGGNPVTSQSCTYQAPTQTIGQKIDAGLTDEEKASSSWTAELISKIAAIIKSILSS